MTFAQLSGLSATAAILVNDTDHFQFYISLLSTACAASYIGCTETNIPSQD